jgi:hypothetical protein
MKSVVKLKGILIVFALLSGCSATEIGRDHDSPENAMSFSLVRVYQRTLRYDCTNTLTSDALEVIQDSREVVKLRPKSGQSLGAEFRNLTTNDSPGGWTSGSNGSSYTFGINVTKTWLDMKVAQGTNKIHYRYGGTPETDEGDVYINVKYSQETKPGTREIYMTPEECATPTPTPSPHAKP